MRKRKSSRLKENKRGKAIFVIPAVLLFLSLVWIWKADRVKDYYSRMKSLEDECKTLTSDNAKLKSELMNFKSLTSIDHAVRRDLNLTQKVKSRIFLQDPVTGNERKRALDLVDMDKISNWLEDAVVKSGRVTAKENNGGEK